ncbi:MAG: permease prefix domain 1-containing protein [Pyrinomonadaceae bacterium]
MKALIESLFRRFDREEIERDVEAELRFHIKLMTQSHFQQCMSPQEARDAALQRFGNVEQIKARCVEIRSRSRPSMRALKFFLIIVFLAGVVVRVLSTHPGVTRCGDLLIAVPILSRLLLYVRALSPSSFLPKHETSTPLMLSESRPTSFSSLDQRGLTPIERVISDK